MSRSRFTEEQIIGGLHEQEAGVPVANLCKKHGLISLTFCKWKAKYGGMDVSEARHLKALDRAIVRQWPEGDGEGERQAEADAGGLDAGQRRAEGSAAKKVVTLAAQREAAAHLQSA